MSEAWLLGNLVKDLTPKKGCQLPTNGDVLHYFVFLNRGPRQKDKIDVIKLVILKIEEFWKHSGIAVTPIQAGNSRAKHNKFILQYENLRKHKIRKNFPAENANFLKYLFQLFDIAHDDAIYILQQDRCRTRKMIMEDVQFFRRS